MEVTHIRKICDAKYAHIFHICVSHIFRICVTSVYAYMCISSVYVRSWKLHIYNRCAYTIDAHILKRCIYTKVVHIWRLSYMHVTEIATTLYMHNLWICAYTRVAHIRKLCTYIEDMCI